MGQCSPGNIARHDGSGRDRGALFETPGSTTPYRAPGRRRRSADQAKARMTRSATRLGSALPPLAFIT